MGIMRAPWPGFGPPGSVVLAIDRQRWAPPATPLVVAGVSFAPKRELHITVLGRALGARVRRALREQDMAREFEALSWRFRRTRRLWRLRREVDGVVQQSLVERIALPAMAAFHGALARRLGEPLPVPPAHVTLFVHGTTEGIGLPDEASFARWNVGEVALP